MKHPQAFVIGNSVIVKWENDKGQTVEYTFENGEWSRIPETISTENEVG